MKTLALASPLLLLICCGGNEDEEPAAPDASVESDAMNDGPAACPGLLPSYDLANVDFTGYARPRDAGDPTSPTVFGLATILDQGPPTDLFEIQLWGGFGVFADAVGPGTYPIEGTETNLNDCGLCALVFGDMAANGSTNMVLVAQSGTFTIDAVNLEAGASFRGTAPVVEYRQVNSGGVIPDGCGLTITNIDFDVTLDAP